MASAANIVSFDSDSEPEDEATYFDENFSSEHLELGADPFPLRGDLRLRMMPTRRNVALAGQYNFPRCHTTHCGGCRTESCRELQTQGVITPSDVCSQCHVGRSELCIRRGQCINFSQQQADYFVAAQQLVLPPSPSPAAPTLRAASPLPPGKIETIPKDQEHLYGEVTEEERQRHQQLIEDSVLARVEATLEQTHLSSQDQQVPEEVQLQGVLEEQLAGGAVGGKVEQGAEVVAEQSSQVQTDTPLRGTEQVTPPSVRPRLILTSEQQQARAGARAKTLGASAISPEDQDPKTGNRTSNGAATNSTFLRTSCTPTRFSCEHPHWHTGDQHDHTGDQPGDTRHHRRHWLCLHCRGLRLNTNQCTGIPRGSRTTSTIVCHLTF